MPSPPSSPRRSPSTPTGCATPTSSWRRSCSSPSQHPGAALPRRVRCTPVSTSSVSNSEVGGDMTPRIAIIGGGSAHWTPRLLVDFVNTAPLAESQVILMDTAPESLPVVQAVADHVVSLASRGTGAGAGLDVTTTTDLNAALAGAQFVITAYSV